MHFKIEFLNRILREMISFLFEIGKSLKVEDVKLTVNVMILRRDSCISYQLKKRKVQTTRVYKVLGR